MEVTRVFIFVMIMLWKNSGPSMGLTLEDHLYENFPCFNSTGECSCENILVQPALWLTGTIPAHIRQCSKLADFDISLQALSGQIPLLPDSLKEIRFYLTPLGGSLDEIIASLPDGLELLYAWGSSITGTLPSSLSRLGRLHSMHLGTNDLQGSIPKEWCGLKGTRTSTRAHGSVLMDLSHNPRLCGQLPTCMDDSSIFQVNLFNTSAYFSRDAELAIQPGTLQGECGASQPVCERQAGCGVYAEPYDSDRTCISFNVTEFSLSGSTGIRSYSWGLTALEPGAPRPSSVHLGALVGGGLQPLWPPLSAATSSSTTTTTGSGCGQTVTTSILGDGRTLYQAKVGFPGLQLMDGQYYAVVVEGASASGPPQFLRVFSDPFLADSSPPLAGKVSLGGLRCLSDDAAKQVAAAFHTRAGLPLDDEVGADPLSHRGVLTACWSGFRDDESRVTGYRVSLETKLEDALTWTAVIPPAGGTSPQCSLQQGVCEGSSPGGPTWLLDAERNLFLVHYPATRLLPDEELRLQVWATNAAGLESAAAEEVDEWEHPAEAGSSTSVEWGMLSGLLFTALVLVVLYLFWLRDSTIQKILKRRRKARYAAAEAVGSAMMELTPESALEGVRRSTCDHGTASTLAFVITDLLDSTAMSTANPAAFKEVQTAHDDVMRAGLKRFRGVELGTQGDSFEVVFTEVDHAVHFCVHVQLSLMEAQWSKAVLALPSCKAVRSRLFGNIERFVGPRVRMGVHVAEEGSFQRSRHEETFLYQYQGPGVELARAVCEAAHGGQVLATAAVLRRLHPLRAGTPTLQSLGVYVLPEFPPQHLLQVHWGLGVARPRRGFGRALRGDAVMTDPGRGLNVYVEPPSSGNSSGSSGSRPTTGMVAVMVIRLVPPTSASAPSPSSTSALRSEATALLHHTIAATAQLMRAQLVQVHEDVGEGIGAVVLESAQEAAELACLLQTTLLHAPWDRLTVEANPQAVDSRGGLVLRGLQVALAVHVGARADVEMLSVAPTPLILTPPQVEKQKPKSFKNLSVNLQNVLQSNPGIDGHTSVNSDNVFKPRRPSVGYPSRTRAPASSTWRRWWDATCIAFETSVLPTDREPASSLPAASSRNLGQAASDEAGGEAVEVLSKAGGQLLSEAVGLCRAARPGQTLLSQPAWEVLQHQHLLNHVQVIDLGVHSVPGCQEEMLLMEIAPFALASRDFPPPKSLNCYAPGYRQAPDPKAGVAIVFCQANVMKGIEHEVEVWSKLCRRLVLFFDGYWCKEVHGPGKFTLAFKTVKNALAFCTQVQQELWEADWDPALEAVGHNYPEPGPLWRGLRVSMGCAFGTDCFKKPLAASGRADYFGALANLAARVAAQAHPGQILVAHRPLRLQGSIDMNNISRGGDTHQRFTTRSVGLVFLKGIGNMELFQVVTTGLLENRNFPPPPGLVTEARCEGRRSPTASVGNFSRMYSSLLNVSPSNNSFPPSPKLDSFTNPSQELRGFSGIFSGLRSMSMQPDHNKLAVPPPAHNHPPIAEPAGLLGAE